MGILRKIKSVLDLNGQQTPRQRRTKKYCPVLKEQVLEERALQSFLTSNVHASQTVLAPTGRYVPVTVTGTFQEYHVVIHTVVVNGKKQQQAQLVDQIQPGPKRSSFQVVDDYRQDEPKRNIALNLVDPVKGTYNFSFTVNLQATCRTTDVSGRHYSIILGAGDTNGWNGEVVTVVVPQPS